MASGLFRTFETDRAAEQEGVWVEYSANDDGTVPGFKLARAAASNSHYKRVLERKMRPHRRALELKAMSDAKAEELLMEVFVEALLLDWRNVQDRDGAVLAYCNEEAIQLMRDLPDLYADLNTKAQDMVLYLMAEREAVAGNLPLSSSTA